MCYIERDIMHALIKKCSLIDLHYDRSWMCAVFMIVFILLLIERACVYVCVCVVLIHSYR